MILPTSSEPWPTAGNISEGGMAALTREPESVITLRNLEPVLTALGKTEEARLVAKRAAGIEGPIPPQASAHRDTRRGAPLPAPGEREG